MKTKSQQARARRSKGAQGEREVAKLLSTWSGELVERKLGAARHGGSDIEWNGYSIEVKRQEKPSIRIWWIQCVHQATLEGNRPLLVWKQNGGEWQCMFFDDGHETIVTFYGWYSAYYEFA